MKFRDAKALGVRRIVYRPGRFRVQREVNTRERRRTVSSVAQAIMSICFCRDFKNHTARARWLNRIAREDVQTGDARIVSKLRRSNGFDTRDRPRKSAVCILMNSSHRFLPALFSRSDIVELTSKFFRSARLLRAHRSFCHARACVGVGKKHRRCTLSSACDYNVAYGNGLNRRRSIKHLMCGSSTAIIVFARRFTCSAKWISFLRKKKCYNGSHDLRPKISPMRIERRVTIISLHPRR